MRSPISGSYLSTPAYYEYSSRIRFSKERPEFSIIRAGKDSTFYDIATDRRVGFSLATNSTGSAWVWSPASFLGEITDAVELTAKAPSDDNLRIGSAISLPGIDGNEITTTTEIMNLTRPGICWDSVAGNYAIGYFDVFGNVVVRKLANSSPPALSTQVSSTAISLPSYDGAVITMISESEYWVSRLDGGLRISQYVSGVEVNQYLLSVSSDLTPSSCSSTTVVKMGLNRAICYESEPGVSSVRIVSSDSLSEPVGVYGASRDYSFHSVRVMGITPINGAYVAVVERGIENSDGIISGYFTALMWSSDCLSWFDWVGVSGVTIRGYAYVIGNKIAVADMGTVCESVGTVKTGNETWQDMTTVVAWSYENSAGSIASVGSIQVGSMSNGPVPETGDIVQIYVTVNGAEFLYATASVDSVRKTEEKTGTYTTLGLRGVLKGAIDHKSAVDDFFPSGDARTIDFSVLSVVPKLGTVSVENGVATIDSVDDDQSHGMCIVPESVTGEFSYALRLDSFDEGSGMVLFAQDELNYLAIIYAGGKYRFYQFEGGTTGAPVYSVDKNVLDVPYLMVDYRSGYIHLYVSRPTSIVDDKTQVYSAEWERIGSYQYTPATNNWYLGFVGPLAAKFHHLYIKEHGYQETIGRLSMKIARRCGVELSVVPVLTDAGPVTSATSYPEIISNLDLEFVSGMAAGQEIGVRFGSGIGASADGGIYLKIEQNKLSIQISNGASWQTVASLVLVDIDDLITLGSNMRVTIMRSDEKTVVLGVYKEGKYLWSTQVPSQVNRGRLTLFSTGSISDIVVHSLSYPILDHSWQVGTPGIDEIKRLIGPMLWDVVEGPGRTALLVPPNYNRGEAGNIDQTTEVLNYVPDDRQWRSMFKVVGAEVYYVYVDPRTITKGMRVEEYDSPYLWSEEECATLAGKISDYSYSLSKSKSLKGFLDPRIEPYDRVTASGDREVVMTVLASVSGTRNPTATMEVKTRREV